MQKIKNSPYFDIWIIVIFIISFILQLGLGFVNREANDDHIEVVTRLMEGSAVEKESCIQCYHPKLYHHSVGFLAGFLDIEGEDDLIIVGQLLNVFTGLLLLVVFWLFFANFSYSNISRRLSFTFLALNPELISSNIQAANNTFVIAFSSIAIISLYKLFETHKNYYFVFVTIFAIFATLSKSSGAVIFIGIFVAFLIYLVSVYRNKSLFKKYLLFLFIFVIAFTSFVAYFGPYVKYWKKYENPFVGNWTVHPFPHFIEKEQLNRPGITSIVDGYLTFRFIDLVKNTNIVSNFDGFTSLRTSFWTQMYARTFSIHFPMWPRSWINTSKEIMNISRAIYILALIPASLIIFGLAVVLKDVCIKLKEEGREYFRNHLEWIYVLFAALILTAIIKFTADLRDFAAIKMLYAYPAIISYVYFLSIGTNTIFKYIQNIYVKRILIYLLIIFFLLIIIDITHLLVQLSK